MKRVLFCVQVGFSRMKLGTVVKFPTTGLDMTPFLAPRSSNMYSQPLPTYRSQRSTPAKSVHFEDEVGEPQRSPLGRSVSVGKGKGKRFLFPWKKQQSVPADKKGRSEKQGDRRQREKGSKKTRSRSRSPDGQRRSRSPDSIRRSSTPPPRSESPTSVRSAPSTIDHRQLQPHHRYFLPPNLSGSRTSLDDTRMQNVYDLYAVCNHTGTLSSGHYTAFCKSPVDGRWYHYDDTTVQPMAEDQLVTSGAYMLFYVRQSLLSTSPLSSSESSQSSCSSANHWIFHMPPFKLDINDYQEELTQLQVQQNQRQSQLSQHSADNHLAAGDMKPRSRLSSTNSALSTPSTAAVNSIGSCVSPPASAPDVDSFTSPASGGMVNSHYPDHNGRSDAFSAVSLPPYQGRRPSHQPAPSYSHAMAFSSRGSGTRHQSLRLGKGRDNAEWMENRRMRREMTSQRHFSPQRSHENVHKSNSQTTFETYNGQLLPPMPGYVVPTRSIPSLTTHKDMSLTPNAYSQEHPHSFIPQLNRQKPAVSNGHIPGSNFISPSFTHSHPESCV